MKFFYNIFITSIKNILNNKSRSFLTMLGIIIGIAAFIVMLAIGNGAKLFVSGQINKLGTNLIFVRPNYRRTGGIAATRSINLTVADGNAIEQKVPNVAAVAPEKFFNKQVKFFNNNVPLSIEGTSEKIFEMLNLPLYSGRYFTKIDISEDRRVCVIGSSAKQYLFGNLSAIGKFIKIAGLPFEVIGVIKPTGGGWHSPDEVVYLPINIAMRRFSKNKRRRNSVNMLYVKVQKLKQSQNVIKNLTKLLRKRHKLPQGADNDFRIFSQEQILSAYMSVTKTLNYLLISIAIIALIVGGIGIMNIMLVTVTERTREIGLRKAIGANNHAVMLQFLVESTILAALGGAIGIISGIVIAEIISKLQNWMIVINGYTIIIGVIFSITVGIFFGVYPSRKAAKMSPIQALHYE